MEARTTVKGAGVEWRSMAGEKVEVLGVGACPPAWCMSAVPLGGRRRKTGGQSADGDISCACFIR